MPASRIISLLPSATEIVCALDCADRLVGRSHACDFPAEMSTIPVCTLSTIQNEATSREIDQDVREKLHRAISLYALDGERIRALRPDLILTQDQCAACAVSLPDAEASLYSWLGKKPKLLSLSPARLTDVWEDIQRVAGAVGVADTGRQLTKKLKNSVVDIIAKSCLIKRPPSVACIEWLDPLMAAGNWVPELVEMAGGLNLFGEMGRHSPWLNWEAITEHDPQVLVLMPCGFPTARTREEMAVLTKRPEWKSLRAVRSSRVYITDGQQYFNRPGPRLVESLQILAEMLHPQKFDFGHRGRGWMVWEG